MRKCGPHLKICPNSIQHRFAIWKFVHYTSCKRIHLEAEVKSGAMLSFWDLSLIRALSRLSWDKMSGKKILKNDLNSMSILWGSAIKSLFPTRKVWLLLYSSICVRKRTTRMYLPQLNALLESTTNKCWKIHIQKGASWKHLRFLQTKDGLACATKNKTVSQLRVTTLVSSLLSLTNNDKVKKIIFSAQHLRFN
jgi:hypothetical protein